MNLVLDCFKRTLDFTKRDIEVSDDESLEGVKLTLPTHVLRVPGSFRQARVWGLWGVFRFCEGDARPRRWWKGGAALGQPLVPALRAGRWVSATGRLPEKRACLDKEPCDHGSKD